MLKKCLTLFPKLLNIMLFAMVNNSALWPISIFLNFILNNFAFERVLIYHRVCKIGRGNLILLAQRKSNNLYAPQSRIKNFNFRLENGLRMSFLISWNITIFIHIQMLAALCHGLLWNIEWGCLLLIKFQHYVIDLQALEQEGQFLS